MKPVILIVEDHDAFRASLRDWLKLEFPQCSILEATNSEEAIELTQIIAPKLVIMDLQLPGMDGIAVAQQIKTSMPDVKVVILTIYEDEIYRSKAMEAGASAYVLKRKFRTNFLSTIALLLSP